MLLIVKVFIDNAMPSQIFYLEGSETIETINKGVEQVYGEIPYSEARGV